MSLYSQFKIGQVQSVSAGGGLSVSTSTGNVIISNTGVLSLTAGADIAISTSTGDTTISSISTLETVTSRGSSSTHIITLTTATASTGTTTGALIVAGGIGVAGSVNIGNQLSVSSQTYIEPQLIVHSKLVDTLNSATVIINSSAPVGYSELTIKNSGLAGSSFTLGVGGNNHALSGGLGINEGNFTIYDNINSAYRVVVLKNGNVLIGGTTDTGNKLQVAGTLSATTATFTGDISATTATFSSTLSATSATFSGALIVQNALVEISVKSINNTVITEVDRFVAATYRSCKMFVQIQDVANFFITEIVLLHNDLGQVYKSEYGIINTGSSDIGEFSADLLGDGIVRLYFTANATSNKVIKIIKTALAT